MFAAAVTASSPLSTDYRSSAPPSACSSSLQPTAVPDPAAATAHLDATRGLYPPTQPSLARAADRDRDREGSSAALFESWVETTSKSTPLQPLHSTSTDPNHSELNPNLNLHPHPLSQQLSGGEFLKPSVPAAPRRRCTNTSKGIGERGGAVKKRKQEEAWENMSTHSGSNHDGENRFAGNGFFPEIPKILPHEKVFPIQIGGELFRLSGASISSDAPSYFSQFFEQQLAGLEEGGTLRTLYIDRDPVTFRDIARHLQGYHVSPRDGQHFVRLFADAQFYSLPKLISQLFESEIYITIGSRPFRIPRELFHSPGNHPNFFSLGFAVFFSSPNEVFPGLSREGLLRPPSILPPEVPNRSAEIFSELLHLLQGYPIHIRSPEHRAQLLRDCKYFNLKGLEQKLIPHEISYNPKRAIHEIVIRLEDIKPSGITFHPDAPPDPITGRAQSGWIHYARPFVDDQSTPRELIVEIGNEATKLDLRSSRADFVGTTLQRVTALFQVIANKLGLPVERPLGLVLKQQLTGTPAPESPKRIPLSEGERVKVYIGPECYLRLDGEECWDREGLIGEEENGNEVPSTGSPVQWPSQQVRGKVPVQGAGRKRVRREEGAGAVGEWLVKRGLWRVRVQTGLKGLEVLLVGVKIEGFSGEHGRNGQRGFLS